MRSLLPQSPSVSHQFWTVANRVSSSFISGFALRTRSAFRGYPSTSSARPFGTAPRAFTGAVAEPAMDRQAASQHSQGVNPEARTSKTTLAHLTNFPFNQLDISPDTKRAVGEVMGYENCTSVQADAIPAMLTGADVVCKAKTGTGKTLAFLIPAIQEVLKNPPPPGSVGVLVISPARELAMQIETEAKQLTQFHNLRTQVVVGGTNMKSEMNRLIQNPPEIVVATPGRLNDHLENGKLRNRMHQLRVLVFDEADRLLDMGFRRDIDKMLSLLPPKEKRQTVLFSATFPKDTSELCQYALRSNFAFIDTVGEDTIDTNKQVLQRYAVTPLADQLAALHQVMHNHKLTEPNYKIMVFFVTANQTAFAAELFAKAGEHVLEMHSRKSQSHRTKTADTFRNADRGVMFSSDVSARGVDYPDVTLVVQVGVPSEREQYIHRVGRTARAGKQGQAVLLLADFEEYFMRQLKDLPVEPLQVADLGTSQRIISAGLPKVCYSAKSKAYAAFLGFYNSQKGVKWSKEQLVQQGNYYSSLLGCPEPPTLLAKTVGMMGLKGVPGLNIQRGARQQQPQQSGGQQVPAQSIPTQHKPAARQASPRQARQQQPYQQPAGFAYDNGSDAGPAKQGLQAKNAEGLWAEDRRQQAPASTSGRRRSEAAQPYARNPVQSHRSPREPYAASSRQQPYAQSTGRPYSSQVAASSGRSQPSTAYRQQEYDVWNDAVAPANELTPLPPGFENGAGGKARKDRGRHRGGRGRQQ